MFLLLWNDMIYLKKKKNIHYKFKLKFFAVVISPLPCLSIFLPLLRRFNPAEPVVEKSVIL
jgi:hypothetical protein